MAKSKQDKQSSAGNKAKTDAEEKAKAKTEPVVIATAKTKKDKDPATLREQMLAELVVDVDALDHELDQRRESIIMEARTKFQLRAKVTSRTTQENVDATKHVIDLVEQGVVWPDDGLIKAFARCTNSFATGPVLMADLQLLAGKVVEFDGDDLPIFKTGTKIGSRFLYQDTLGFIRVIGRMPITVAEAYASDGPADLQSVKTYLSHCAICGYDFWCPEASHQLHCPVCTWELKKNVARQGSVAIDSSETALIKLRKQLAYYDQLAEKATKAANKEAFSKKRNQISSYIDSLVAEEA